MPSCDGHQFDSCIPHHPVPANRRGFRVRNNTRNSCRLARCKSQAHEGWRLIRNCYDDGGYSGGSMDRPALKKLLDDVRSRRIDVIVVYKVDRLTRSLADFAKLVELFDAERRISSLTVEARPAHALADQAPHDASIGGHALIG